MASDIQESPHDGARAHVSTAAGLLNATIDEVERFFDKYFKPKDDEDANEYLPDLADLSASDQAGLARWLK
jgi:hypothetical protein